jgi:hypothetical protein
LAGERAASGGETEAGNSVDDPTGVRADPRLDRGAMRGGGRSVWPIVVGACFSSGMTLVRRILNAHPRVFCGPKTAFFADWYHE